jgi:hypothetical protein
MEIPITLNFVIFAIPAIVAGIATFMIRSTGVS